MRIADVGRGAGLICEPLAARGASEVVEHVDDVPAFVRDAAAHLAPGGLLLASTINRTLRGYLAAIIGGAMVLRVLPRGTHQWAQFLRPQESSRPPRLAGCPRASAEA